MRPLQYNPALASNRSGVGWQGRISNVMRGYFMRTTHLALLSVLAILLGFSANAHASWKGSVFNQNTSDPASVPKKTTRPDRPAKSTAVARKPAAKRSAPKRTATKPRAKQAPVKSASSGRTLRGLASFYWQPQRVASGGWFNPNALTAAHKTLRFGTRVRVTNLRNGRSVVVRINDRGPYIKGRIIDLSKRAAIAVGMQNSGVVPVRVEVL